MINIDSSKLPNRVDANRFSSAIKAADFIVTHHDKDGHYAVNQSWGPEGEIYRAVCIWILVDIYQLTKNKSYISTARTLLLRFAKKQQNSGGWPICLGNDGLRFKITHSEREDSNQQEDPVIAGAMLKSISDYAQCTGSHEFDEMGVATYRYISNIWDESKGSINENKERELSGLRSNPDAYHFLVLQGIAAWANNGSKDAQDKLPKILAFVQSTFEAFNNETMPLMIGYHVAILAKHKNLKYLQNTIKPKLDAYLKSGLFASNTFKGGYGHHDGLRGIVTDELHIRSAIGIAYALKAYDYATNTSQFTQSKVYTDVINWIDSMQDKDGSYFEFQDTDNGQKLGKGSPAQYLTVLWILGTTLF